MGKIYTIGESAAELGTPASTIRLYDKNGLFPDVARSQGHPCSPRTTWSGRASSSA